jgi:hypothetical protein
MDAIKGLSPKGIHIDEACITGQLFEFMGRIAKERLTNYFSDLALDVQQLESTIKTACDKCRETGDAQTVIFWWMCRENGTHLCNLSIGNTTGREWMGSALKTFGGEPNDQLYITITLDMDDYVKRELKYLEDKDKRVRGSYEVAEVKNS